MIPAAACGGLALLLLATAAGAAPADPGLRRELLAMAELDQRYRLPGQEDNERMAAADSLNLARLKALVATHGWPTISQVGEDGAEAAWLIAQHADSDPAFQGEVLTRIQALLPAGEADAGDYAYLFDRLHITQRYGTQGRCGTDGRWSPKTMEEPDQVDQRRAAVGLRPLAEYARTVSVELCSKKGGSGGKP
ncbi:MAG: hypothetical protein LJE84_03630 [Gammaproteobacteria bacterium]|jgi:hypothetical protein|nr:hypothetical protein [Gammaproteobacteria bacterium]